MTYDYSKLNGRIREICGSQQVFAHRLGLSERSISLKLNCKVGWRQQEIERACGILRIEHREIPEYFFTQQFNIEHA